MRQIFPKAQQRSRELVEIFEDVVAATSVGCKIAVARGNEVTQIDCPTINYTFGNGQYVKERLDELSRTDKGNEMKFPLIVLFVPATETRGKDNIYYSKSKVKVLIACSSKQQWSNEERKVYSFEYILRPIYRRFIEALKEDGRFDFAEDEVPHEYSENYTYGRYGAYSSAGDAVSEPIDAININNLELNIKPQNCR
jgi:hypothetical protein